MNQSWINIGWGWKWWQWRWRGWRWWRWWWWWSSKTSTFLRVETTNHYHHYHHYHHRHHHHHHDYEYLWTQCQPLQVDCCLSSFLFCRFLFGSSGLTKWGFPISNQWLWGILRVYDFWKTPMFGPHLISRKGAWKRLYLFKALVYSQHLFFISWGSMVPSQK